MIKNKDDLIQIKNLVNDEKEKYKYRILVCAGAGCISSNCYTVRDAVIEALNEYKVENVQVVETGCMGTCDIGPVMLVMPGEIFYTKLDAVSAKEIVYSHIVNDEILIEKTYMDKKTGTHIPCLKDIEYFKAQVKIALKNCGTISYSSIGEYIANDGYFSLAKVLEEMSSHEVVEVIADSMLRGRGGGGFPTGIKLQAGLNAADSSKYIVCNADEGDPGAFMDRSILEGDPHCVIEGMIIGAYSIGASKGYVYVRAEYPIAVNRLDDAIKDSYSKGLLGKNILGSGFDFDLEIRVGAGAFVCGEETALMESIEGRRGEPRQKPPLPFEKGLFAKPTIISNVETFANMPSIILNGSDWFKSIGTEKSKGTKVFALAGDINNTGIAEVPMGITVGEIIYDIGGGIPGKKKFKALQTGGPSGGCLTKKHLNTPIDYDSLVKLGTIMGSGGMIVMDEETCMVDMARFFMEFIQEESCGKCIPCRLGTKRMLEILERITRGEGREGDIELLEEIGQMVKQAAVCGLGQTAPNPVLNTIRYFRNEYEEHIHDKYCRAGVCSDMFTAPCQNACPAGVNVPGYVALIAAGRVREAYNLIRKENPFPAVCGRVCTHPCESVCRRAQLDEPLAIADLKRYAADFVMNHSEPYLDLVFPDKGKSVGIIGAGPSGLTCGYYLARLGYSVEVYESKNVAGGVLAFGIPEYRLPKHIIDYEIEQICRTGVKIHLNTEVGKDITFEKLRSKHSAVYIATGTQISRKADIPGEDLEGVFHGLDFLREVNLGNKVRTGKKVVVIGGGNTAIDSARTALRLGAEKVVILYRRGIEDMPADEREIRDALEEGIEIITYAAPVEICGKEKAQGLNCVKMKLGRFDDSGRRTPVIDEEGNFFIETDTIIPAVSQYSDLPFIRRDEVEITSWGTFVTDAKTLMTKMKGVFAGGDVARGSDVVITAIADGKNAARSIDIYLGGDGVLNTGEDIEIPDPEEDEEHKEHERFEMKYLDPDLRKKSFAEVSQGFHRLNAVAEAMRCLRCDRRV